MVAQSKSEDIKIPTEAIKEVEMDEVISPISIKVEECDSDIEDALSSHASESSPSSPDSGIHGDSFEDLCIFGDVSGMVGNPTIDEILMKGDVKNLATSIDPQMDEAVVDNMTWEDPFLELFPSLMAV